MSWTEKKLSLPFMGVDSKVRSQEEGSTRDSGILMEEAPIIRSASLKKLKSNKKKWFVLTASTPTTPAKLEYYDNERKWKSKATPKRQIVLEKCFNINRKLDTRDSRNKFVISLYTLDDCVSIVFETENELNDWLDQLLTLQQGKFGNIDGRKPTPNFEHVFTVTVKHFSPDENNFTQVNHLLGQQRLCVTSEDVIFFPVGSEDSVEFPHACIRCLHASDRHFKLETGRNSPTGSGSLLIDCDDKDVTHHLHDTLLKAMQNSKNKEQYLPKSSRFRSHSVSETAQKSNQNFPPKSLPKNVEKRSRTISEPPDKPGQVTPEPGLPPRRPVSVRYGGSYSTSPNIKSPISPVGSFSTGISSDGTGSSNSINDGEHEMVYYSNQPDVIPEESSGEISIEFNPKNEKLASVTSNQTLPRAQPAHHGKYVHQKQASLTEFTMDDYMVMTVGSNHSKPPEDERKGLEESSGISGISGSPRRENVTSPSDSQPSSSYSSEYHIMSPKLPSQMSPSDQDLYFDMDRLNIGERDQPTTSTPLKSTSSTTLVNSESVEAGGCSSPSARTPPVAIRGGSGPCTVLTPPEDDTGKTRMPSGDGYVVMSPGVCHNLPLDGAGDTSGLPSSLALLEESLGNQSGGHWRASPRHASPSYRKERSGPSQCGSKRNSSCFDDSEAHWEAWRYEDPPLEQDDNYAMVYYPGRSVTSRNTVATPLSRVSPASSSSAVSGTPSSDSRLTDFHDRLHQISSFIREDDDDRITARPPQSGGRKITTPKHMEIPCSSSTVSTNSSRSNISPFGKTPPNLLAGSPTIVSRIEGLLFRHRAGSVPTRPPLERRRHRTQSEGEKDAGPP